MLPFILLALVQILLSPSKGVVGELWKIKEGYQHREGGYQE